MIFYIGLCDPMLDNPSVLAAFVPFLLFLIFIYLCTELDPVTDIFFFVYVNCKGIATTLRLSWLESFVTKVRMRTDWFH